MNRSLALPALALLALASLCGCASLSESECMSANWEDVGIRDGANGRPEEYLIQHSQACSKVNVAPDRGAWLKGREQGLERFCTPYRLYQAGESGSGVDLSVCRGFDEERLQNAYERGRDVNRLAGEINQIDNDMRNVRSQLERKDLEQKERERLAYRLGQLEYARRDAQDAYDHARDRARNL